MQERASLAQERALAHEKALASALEQVCRKSLLKLGCVWLVDFFVLVQWWNMRDRTEPPTTLCYCRDGLGCRVTCCCGDG